VLLTGESGTGKEVVAHADPRALAAAGGPFVAVSCGALPGELLESELFGHVRGAFTGAVRDRAGRFELAAGGTSSSTRWRTCPPPPGEAAARPPGADFERVGESAARTSDARIVAATHVDLRRAVQEGRFREDLYYRLRVVPIEIPPLRDRREDIERSPRSSWRASAHGRARAALLARRPAPAPRALLAGNVRELENALEYAVAVCKGQTILPEDLPGEVGARSRSRRPRPRCTRRPSAARRMAATEADVIDAARIRGALEACRWKRHEAARVLGVSRTTLWRRMRELGLE